MKKNNLKLKLIVKDTKKYGKGVFAGENIEKGTVIHLFDGERMDVTELVKKVNSAKENIDDPFQIGRRTYIDLDKMSRSFNHSCEPNSGIRKVSEMFALRDIKKGEEITFDYSTTISPTVWSMKCKCGSKMCRKNLGDILSIPKEGLKEYKKNGALQRYMKLLLKEIEIGNYKIPRYEVEALKKLQNN